MLNSDYMGLGKMGKMKAHQGMINMHVQYNCLYLAKNKNKHNKIYSKTCLKRPLENRQNKDLNDKW